MKKNRKQRREEKFTSPYRGNYEAMVRGRRRGLIEGYALFVQAWSERHPEHREELDQMVAEMVDA